MDILLQLLNKHGVRYTLHSHAPLLTLRDIEEHVTFPVEGMVKTMVFRIKPSTWVLVALGAYSRVDYRKLADALGVKRGYLVQAPPEEVEAELGFQVGGVAPIPPREGVPGRPRRAVRRPTASLSFRVPGRNLVVKARNKEVKIVVLVRGGWTASFLFKVSQINLVLLA